MQLTYGEIVRKTYEAEGFNSKTFADTVGVSRSHLAGIVVGIRLPSYALHKRICRALALDEEFYNVASDVDFAPRLTFRKTETCRGIKNDRDE